LNGHSTVLRNNPDKKLSGWVKRQRDVRRSGALAQYHIDLLDQLDFIWCQPDHRWKTKCDSLVEYQNRFGNCVVIASNDKSLAEWTQRQRREYRTSCAGMTLERIISLEKVRGWTWDTDSPRNKKNRAAGK